MGDHSDSCPLNAAACRASQLWAQAGTGACAPPIDAYIHKGWDSLSRSMSECQTLVDPKVTTSAAAVPALRRTDSTRSRRLSSQCKIDVEHLPRRIIHLGDVKQSELKTRAALSAQALRGPRRQIQ